MTSTLTPFPVAPWKILYITSDLNVYGTSARSRRPHSMSSILTTFLITPACCTPTSPILQYTEGLTWGSLEDTLAQQLCGEIATIGLLLGLIPACFVLSIVLVNEHRLSVVLSVLSTSATCILAKKWLGLSIFHADLGDEQLVHILRQCPNDGPESPEEKNLHIGGRPMKTSGACAFVTLDKVRKTPLSFITRVDIVEPGMKVFPTSGASPIANQVSMHSIAIVLGDKFLKFPFPLPVGAKKAKLRIAQKSLYIEIILPLKLILGETDLDMFPVIPYGGDLAL
ncbi:uncharacterized protein BJ212DRAFT_1479797 [Suillus subaureus]|uniref:Uncharacterized protein n=1 Tax=Suillus subaureus TaxID=48587 RepID=A0A9P7JEP1_9AGAM|nr:uncharacterized protein BJ212DRAFT_1479797 [Suillus subaureus]KAG1817976.1 hypothetical protein BJ212DRAFT_1479797 [Suillus subaureus]